MGNSGRDAFSSPGAVMSPPINTVEHLLGELSGEVKGLNKNVIRLQESHDAFVQSNNDRHMLHEGRHYAYALKNDERVSRLEDSKLSLLVSTRTAVTVGLLGIGLILHGLKDTIIGFLEWVRGI